MSVWKGLVPLSRSKYIRPAVLSVLHTHRGMAARAQANHYELLGVEQTATTEEIKAAYFRLSRLHHPDTASAPDLMKFQEIGEAYSVLASQEKRTLYDRTLKITGVSVQSADYTGPSKYHTASTSGETLRRQSYINTRRMADAKEKRLDNDRVVERTEDIRSSRLYWYLGFAFASIGAYYWIRRTREQAQQDRIRRARFMSG